MPPKKKVPATKKHTHIELLEAFSVAFLASVQWAAMTEDDEEKAFRIGLSDAIGRRFQHAADMVCKETAKKKEAGDDDGEA